MILAVSEIVSLRLFCVQDWRRINLVGREHDTDNGQSGRHGQGGLRIQTDLGSGKALVTRMWCVRMTKSVKGSRD